jgi:hypothetical protein
MQPSSAREPSQSLPRLEDVRIAAPCSASWDAMKGDERVRFCEACGKNVYNLSALPRREAEQLLADTGGAICKQLYKRADGTVITADCPVGVVRRLRVRRVFALATSAGALALAAVLYRSPVRVAVPVVAATPEPSAPAPTALAPAPAPTPSASAGNDLCVPPSPDDAPVAPPVVPSPSAAPHRLGVAKPRIKHDFQRLTGI